MVKKKGGAVGAASTGELASAKAADKGLPAAAASSEMLFEADAVRHIPAGVRQILLKIAEAGESQSVSLGVAVFEKLTDASPWIVLAKQEIDNLAVTPEQSFLSIAPKVGASYAMTFAGEMHALSLGNEALTLRLIVSGEGVGEPIEDFSGTRTVNGRFCTVRGRALLKA